MIPKQLCKNRKILVPLWKIQWDCEDPDWLLSCNLQRKARMDGLDQELLG